MADFKIRLTLLAASMLSECPKQVRKKAKDKIDGLSTNPDQQGRPLKGKLFGFRRIVCAGRYRIIYHVCTEETMTTVVAVGIRKEGDKNNIYTVATKIAEKGDLLS